MAIRCANCNETHETIQEVKDCHGAPESNNETPKQRSYINSLLRDRVVQGDFFDKWSQPMNKAEASLVIDELLSLPKKGARPANIIGEIPKHGTYTVVFNEGARRTIRIRKPHPKANFAVAEYLYGPDNTNDYRRFAREAPDGWRLGAGAGDPRYMVTVINALKALMEASEETLAEMGYAYALESGNCYRCGRKLTVPASIHRGMGPVCAGKEARV